MKPIQLKKMPTKTNKLNIRSLSLLLFAIFVLSACEIDDPNEDPLAIRDNYVGTWQVTENTGINHPQFYQVSIALGNQEDEIFIAGLYNEQGTVVTAVVSGSQVSIPNQSTANIIFIGSGSANADYSQVSLNFSADDGSGPDQIEAVLVR
jgi:hypothetical protein